MKIAFYLPPILVKPVGGYKIIYEYANRLSKRGYEITIIYDYSNKGIKYKKYLGKVLYSILVWLLAHIEAMNNPCWFNLSSKVRQKCIFSVSDKTVGKHDVIIATAYSTSSCVASLSDEYKKLYFIQGFEAWSGITEDMVIRSYKKGMINVVISKWLKNIVDNAVGDESSILIHNGIDFEVFNIDIEIEKRNPYSISMLYHASEYKGCEYGIEVLINLKRIYPELTAHLFGVPKRPSGLPEWIKYTRNANQKELRNIYNESAFFLCPTISDGFGLTGAESMACGCMLVSTDYGGVHEYATNGVDVLLSPVRDVFTMTSNFEYLIEHPNERIKMARNGYNNIRRLDWNKSVDKMEACLIAKGGNLLG